VKSDTGESWTINPRRTAQDIPADDLEAAGWLVLNVLTPRQRQIVTRAAASGIQFPHQAEWLTETAGEPSAVEIEELEKTGFAQRYLDSGSGERWSRFRHESIREALYAQLDVQTRANLHRAIIQWYKRYAPGNASMSIIGAHAERAGWSQEAVHAYLKAATFAIAWGAKSEALQCLLAAERHLAHVPQSRPDLLFDLALTRANLHLVYEQYAEGRAQAEKALSYAKASKSSLNMARSLLFIAQFAQHEGELNTLDQATNRALTLAREATDPRIITEASWLRAKALMVTNKRREAVQLLVQALEKGTIDDDELELEMRIDVVHMLLVDHYRERANEHVQRLYEQTIRLDNPVLMHQVMGHYGHVQLLYGKIKDALHALERALALPPPPQSGMLALGQVLLNHGVALCYAGRYMDAGPVFKAAVDYFESEKDQDQVLYAQLMCAFEMHLDCQNWDAIQTTLDACNGENEQVIEQSLRRDEMIILRELLRLSVEINGQNYERAVSIADALLHLPDSSAKRWFFPVIYIRCAELKLAQGRYDEACNYAYQALGAVSTHGDLRYLTSSYAVLAEALLLRGEQTSDEAVRDALQRAIKSGREHGRRLHLARTLLLMGHYLQQTSHLHRTRARGGSFRFEAEQIYKEIGLAPPIKIAGFEKTSPATLTATGS
jgi:tetratricopeptide (TPR) repeat protein